jgi:hypothetical protein
VTGAPRRATAVDRDAVARILVGAFHEDPAWAWACPDPALRAEQHRALWSLVADGRWAPTRRGGPPAPALRSSRCGARPARRLTGETAGMAYDVELADRVREVVGGEAGLTEKTMFGGLAFLIGGNMAVAASGQGGLLLRVDPARTESLVDPPAVDRFEMRGRQMDGWLRVDPEVVSADADLRAWVAHGVGYARSLPPK